MKKYEIFLDSDDISIIKFDCWIPIEYDSIKNPEKIDHYIKIGLLRESSEFNCQRYFEMESICDEQCNHCKEYYKEMESLTKEDVIRLEFLDFLESNFGINKTVVWNSFIQKKLPSQDFGDL